MWYIKQKKLFAKDDDMYHSDSDENIRRYRLGHVPQEQHLNPRPSSTLSLNQLNFRRRSNPDIYPGTRRYSTSYSDEDILSNDQLDQIHFDPRYRDYRSASSLNNSNYRSRSNSLHSMASTGNIITPQYQPFRRVSSQSPPLIAPLIPQKRWDTNPSIFIEEYCDNEDNAHKSESLKSENDKNSKETLCTSNESLQPALSIHDIKSFGDLTEIPFIDDDSNDSAPCRVLSNDEIVPKKESTNTCRKTVSFDMLKSGPSQQCLYSSASNGKNFPKNPHKNIDYTYKNTPQLFPIASKCTTNPSFHTSCSLMHQHHFHRCHNNNINNISSHHASRAMSNVRRTKDGYVIRSQSVPKSKFSSSSNDDHCTLIDKLIKIRMEEKHEREQNKQKHQLENGHEKKLDLLNYKIKWDEINGNENDKICSGKVKALTTYFNSLPFMSTECNCINIIHQSTPNLSIMSNSVNNKLSHDEMAIVRKQLKEWSEYGLRKSTKDKLVCTFMKDAVSSPIICLENELYGDCKQYHEILNRLDKIKMKRANHHSSLSDINDLECLNIPRLPDCFVLKKSSHCQQKCENIENARAPFSYNFEKHKCRSPCYNIKRDSSKKCKKKNLKSKLTTSSHQKLPHHQQSHQKYDDDNESLII